MPVIAMTYFLPRVESYRVESVFMPPLSFSLAGRAHHIPAALMGQETGLGSAVLQKLL
jgi:hypothetical protein